jgi:hypothetical protein
MYADNQLFTDMVRRERRTAPAASGARGYHDKGSGRVSASFLSLGRSSLETYSKLHTVLGYNPLMQLDPSQTQDWEDALITSPAGLRRRSTACIPPPLQSQTQLALR